MPRLRNLWPASLGRNFARLWAAQATSAIGSRLTRTALPVIAILGIDASPVELGVLAALSMAPGAIVGLLAGGAIDRSRKRRILVGADLARLALLLTIPVAAWTGYLTIEQLFAVAALAGCATVLFQITDNTYLPSLVAREHLIGANARLETTEAVAEITGPGLAGVLIEVITAPVTILLDALTYAASAVILTRIDVDEDVVDRAKAEAEAAEAEAKAEAKAKDPRRREPRRASLETLARDIATGAAAVWEIPLIRSLFWAEAAMAFFGGFFFALYMLFTLDTLALSPGVVGVVISMGGVGALFGAAVAARISRARRAAPVLFVLLVLAQLGELLIPAARGPMWQVLAFLVAHQLIGDGFGAAFKIIAVSLRQRLIPGDRLGRANAFFQTAASALLPLGALVAGVLASVIGVREALWVGVICGLTAPLFLLPRLRALDSISIDAMVVNGEPDHPDPV